MQNSKSIKQLNIMSSSVKDMENNITVNVASDAVPSATSSNNLDNPFSALEFLMDKLREDDYRSIFFLLMDFIGPRDFLYIVHKNIEELKHKFRDIYYEFPHKKAMLIELFGTMKKFNLLKQLKSCCHIFKIDQESYSQINPLWKMLYSICEQLSDSQVTHLKEKLLPNTPTIIVCAEQLLCEALLAQVFEENNFSKLKDIFRGFHPECFQIISSYEGASKLCYYPIKRPTKDSPCGHAIILNHEQFYENGNISPFLPERPYSRRDAEALKKLWKSFGFETHLYNDLKHEEIITLFNDLARLDHSSCDVFVTCILSHGEQGVFFAHDAFAVSLKQLTTIMANKCSTLCQKPKLFFVQACQGRQIQEGVYKLGHVDTFTDPIDLAHLKVSMNTPVLSDVLIAHATIEGYACFTPSGQNSWFIGTFVQMMEKYGDELTLLNILNKVKDHVARKKGIMNDESGLHANCKQTVCVNETLRRELKFKKLLS